MPRKLMPLMLLSATLMLSACNFTPFLYKVDVVQGNLFNQNDIARIQPGMTRTEVRRILGSATLNDPFQPNVVVYPYRYRAGKTDHIYQGSLTITYTDSGVVANVEETPVSLVE